jgi:PAS domain S-box-containing protein
MVERAGGEAGGDGQLDALARAARAENELERFFTLSLDLLCVATTTGFFLRVNPAFERVLGYGREELLRVPFLDLVHPQDRASTLAELESISDGTHTVALENRYRRRDGSYCWLQWMGIPDPERGVISAMARDVTEAKRSESELRTLLAEQAALRRVATLVAREGEHHAVFQVVAEEVGGLLDADLAAVVRYESDRTGLVVGAWGKHGEPLVPAGTAIELTAGTAAGRVHRTGQATRVDRFDGEDGSLERDLWRLGFRSAVGAPIRLAGRLWGAINVACVRDEPLADGTETRLASFAELVAQALANADARQQLAASRARLIEASDAERRRLERNLHDGAQQRLVTLSLTVRLARARLAAHPDDAVRLLDAAGEELTHALAELRELAHGLHPAVLSQRGLGAALASLATRASLPVEVLAVPDERLPEPVEVATCYLVSEALTNTAKYARATSAAVAVRREDGRVCVEVVDDGVGGADARGGSGLRGLSDRIGALGGQVIVTSPAGEGTTVRAEIPLGADAPTGVADASAPVSRR